MGRRSWISVSGDGAGGKFIRDEFESVTGEVFIQKMNAVDFQPDEFWKKREQTKGRSHTEAATPNAWPDPSTLSKAKHAVEPLRIRPTNPEPFRGYSFV